MGNKAYQYKNLLTTNTSILIAIMAIIFALIIGRAIAFGDKRIMLLGGFLVAAIFAVSFRKTYEVLMVGMFCYIFLLPWQSSGANTFQTWGLPNRGVFGYRVGEHIMVFLALFFFLLVNEFLKSKLQRSKKPELPMLTIFILFLVFGSISSFQAYDSIESFFVLTSRVVLLAMCIFYITYICAMRSNKFALIKLFVLVASICALYGIFEYLIEENPLNDFYGTYFADDLDTSFFIETYSYQMGNKAYRITSTFGNPEFAASIFAVTSILSIAIASFKKGGYLFIGAFFINSIALMFTFTRGGILSYIISLSLFTFFVAKKSRLLKNMLSITILGGIIYILWGYFGDYVSLRLSGPGSPSFDSILHRLYAYPIFIKFILSSPFFGIGLGSTNYLHAYNLFASSGYSSADTLDNTYLSLISGMGITSLVPIILFIKKLKIILLDSFMNFSDNHYTLKVGLASSIIGILFSFLFYDGLCYLVTTSMLFILVGISFSYYRYQI